MNETAPLGKPAKPKFHSLSTRHLEGMLVAGLEHHRRVTEQLRTLPEGMAEQKQLLDRESKLVGVIKQLEQQIIMRREG